MTRKGRLPIPVPSNVEVKVNQRTLSIKGPKGTIQQELAEGIDVKIENNAITVSLAEGDQGKRNLHGLYRTLIDNMVTGTTKGFEKKLEMVGVGYRAAVQGQSLNLQIGFSHPTLLPIPKGIEVKVDKNTTIIITGVDNRTVGQFAATIRSMKPPEPYQGKGIRYQGEYVRRKAGKAAAKK
jgi:large subunit ribosomal protein L6